MRKQAEVAPSCEPEDSHRRWSEAPCLGESRWFQEWNAQRHYIYDIM